MLPLCVDTIPPSDGTSLHLNHVTWKDAEILKRLIRDKMKDIWTVPFCDKLVLILKCIRYTQVIPSVQQEPQELRRSWPDWRFICLSCKRGWGWSCWAGYTW